MSLLPALCEFSALFPCSLIPRLRLSDVPFSRLLVLSEEKPLSDIKAVVVRHILR